MMMRKTRMKSAERGLQNEYRVDGVMIGWIGGKWGKGESAE
jgi:hypothetical protein